ncbi:hypothetical protein PENSPDRAFT_639534 [Peniophora sp. CONT]|nr:hypothetical protein PENSPDRAFT_639534 [Peniophora sp. CONT]
MTGWGDELDEEDAEHSAAPSDGDILGDVKGSARRRRGSTPGSPAVPVLDETWELDGDAFVHGTPSTFRQSTQAHTDWVNDILLTPDARTLVSASSDGTVKLWHPHASPVADPQLLGMHTDYARCLALPRAHTWVASGSFDRTIKLWDLSRASSRANQALLTLNPPESAGPKASIYALAVDPLGHTLVSGGPERVIRMWDPRAGKRIGKLVGHTDNIRSILVSDDSRYLLTASADASIKLWSLTSQRCLHTFTHHTDSVWSLHSTHPTLQIFYSGDKSGQLARVDAEGCTDMADAECIALAVAHDGVHGQETGIDKIVSSGDGLVWAASGSSAVKRWRAPKRRVDRAAAMSNSSTNLNSPIDGLPSPDEPVLTRRGPRRALTVDVPSHPPVSHPGSLRGRHSHSLSLPPGSHPLSNTNTNGEDEEGVRTSYGLPFESLVRLSGPHDPFGMGFSPGLGRRDTDVATLYSAASVHSVPAHRLGSIFPSLSLINTTPGTSASNQYYGGRAGSPVASEITHDEFAEGMPPKTPRADWEERDELTDAVPLEGSPDYVIGGGTGLVRAALLSDRVHALAVDARGVVSAWDLARGICVGIWSRKEVCGAWARSHSDHEHSEGEEEGGGHGNGNGHDDEHTLSPREALEFVRERVEGEAVVPAWCAVEARVGVLTVHLNERCFEAEVYADEAGAVGVGDGKGRPEDVRVNLGKWVLRNLFASFVREELRQRGRSSNSPLPRTASGSSLSSPSPSPGSIPRHASSPNLDLSASPHSPLLSPSIPSTSTIVISPTILRAQPLPKPTHTIPLPPPVATRFALHQPLSPIVQSPSDWTPKPHTRAATDVTTPSANVVTPSAHSSGGGGDYFTMRARGTSISSASVPVHPGAVPIPIPSTAEPELEPATPASAREGGFMGRLKTLGKMSRRGGPAESPSITGLTKPSSGLNPSSATPDTNANSAPLSPAAQLLNSAPLAPPNTPDAGPSVKLPGGMHVVVAEEHEAGWSTLWRSTVSGMRNNGPGTSEIEEVLPIWALEYLLFGRAPVVGVVKLGFVLLPWRGGGGDGEELPEVLNTSQSKLTASRALRVRKLCGHVQDRIERLSKSRAGSARSSFDAHSIHTLATTHGGGGNGGSPEESWEILCVDKVLPLDMTLAAVRQFVWRQSGELVMHYRRRRPAMPA